MVYSKRLSDDVIEIHGGKQPSSNVYLILSKRMLIDLGSRAESKNIINELKKYNIDPASIITVVFTHLHFDHTGNPLLFKNSVFYASKEELESLRHPLNFADRSLKKIKINELKQTIDSLKVIKTPGHTKGSVCLWKEDERILFTGDMLFRTGAIGRTDLPTSIPSEMQKSMMKIIKYNYNHLAPGHTLEKE